MITEIVKFRTNDGITEEEVLAKAETLNEFQMQQDGFIDCELVRHIEEGEWSLLYHFENMEKVKAVGAKMRESKIFDGFMPIVLPGSLTITFYFSVKKW